MKDYEFIMACKNERELKKERERMKKRTNDAVLVYVLVLVISSFILGLIHGVLY